MSRSKGILWYAGFCTLVVLTFACRQWLPDFRPRSGPQTLAELIAIAEARGLYYGSDQRMDGPIGRLVISETPVTRNRAGRVRINAPLHPCWINTVAVYFPVGQMMTNYDPQCSVIWGNMFVYGDPALIELLTGLRPEVE